MNYLVDNLNTLFWLVHVILGCIYWNVLLAWICFHWIHLRPLLDLKLNTKIKPLTKNCSTCIVLISLHNSFRGRNGHARMVVGFITTYVISTYHHWCWEFESRSGRGVHVPTLCDKVCQWLATGQWFSPGPPVSSTNKTDRHHITEILLKVALNTIKQYLTSFFSVLSKLSRIVSNHIWDLKVCNMSSLHLFYSHLRSIIGNP